jgi:hypothetical protein
LILRRGDNNLSGLFSYVAQPAQAPPPVVSDEAGALSSKSINDIPCDEPETAASSSDIGLEANEKSPSSFLKASYLVRTMLI